MNIAFLHKDYWPPVEGSSLQSWQLYSRLSKNHTLYTPYTCPFPGAKHRYNSIRDIREFLRSVDVVFIIVDGLFYFFEEKFALLAKLERKPVVWLLNSPLEESLLFPGYQQKKFFLDVIKRKLLSSCVDTCVSVSKPLSDYAQQNFFAKAYTVIPNGTDPKQFYPHSQKKLRKKTPFQVVWVGSGEYPWHAMDLIVQVIQRMSKESPDIGFTLVVNKSWFPLPKLPNLRIIGPLEHSQLPAVYAESDLALCLYHQVFPFGFYNSPLKLFEAMATGTPVIASNLGQISEVITDHINGFLTDNSIDHIVACITEAKSHPTLLKKLGKQAKLTIQKHYTWDQMVKQLEQVFSNVTKAQP